MCQSPILSEYGLRHAKLSRTENKYWIGHAVIAATELTPIVGLIATVSEVTINIFYYIYSFVK
jgi:hypothetical protein